MLQITDLEVGQFFGVFVVQPAPLWILFGCCWCIDCMCDGIADLQYSILSYLFSIAADSEAIACLSCIWAVVPSARMDKGK